MIDLELNEVEREAWMHSREEKFDSETLYEVLSNLKNDQVRIFPKMKMIEKIVKNLKITLQSHRGWCQ